MKLNKKIFNELILECIGELILENLELPDFPNKVNTSNGMFEIPKNVKVDRFKYSGLTEEQENRLHKIIVHHVWNPTDKTKKILENAYLYLIGYNPQLNSIDTNINGYNPRSSPIKDIVHGVISGISPYDIYNFVVNLKGDGKNSKFKDPTKKYIPST